MTPIGLLMIEHRLIERMIQLLKKKAPVFEKSGQADSAFVDMAADFLTVYADECHHGKEEKLLFANLAGKKLKPPHRTIMEELIQEHRAGRVMVTSLAAANEKYKRGTNGAVHDIVRAMQSLLTLYPKHIEKEDKHFFLPSMDYFTAQERSAMLGEFREFDRNLIHRRYRLAVESLEKKG